MTQTSHQLAGTLTCVRTRLTTAPSLAVARSKPRPGYGRFDDYGEFCNIVGGVISPILANIYLHNVLDEWFEQMVKPRMRGRAFVVRYADDFIIGFSDEHDARRVMDVLPKRLAEYGLTIHPAKTRLVRFNRPPRTGNPPKGEKPETFDFLGFTHYWRRSRYGYWVVQRKTASNRLSRSLRSISEWCRANRHLAVSDQHAQLSRKMRGHYAYYGMTGNGASLEQFWEGVKRIWKKWLGRRSQRAYFAWPVFVRLLGRYPLPKPIVVHSVYRKQRNQDLRSRMR